MTGLPYEATPPTKAGGWTGDYNYKFYDSYAQIGDITGAGPCSITSKAFYLPSTVNIKVWTDCSLHALNFIGWINTTFTVNINGKALITQGSDKKKEWRTQLTGTGTMANGNTINCKSSYGAAGPYVKVHAITVDYL